MTPPASLENDFLYMFRNIVQTDFQSSCSHSGYDDTSHHLVLCCPTPYLRMARCRWFEEVLGDQKLSSDLLLTFMTVDFDIQLGMWTCGHDTSRQFGERLVVHVENQSANRWKDCVQCCGSHSGRHVTGHVPRFLSVLEHCTCRNFHCELIWQAEPATAWR